jgi:hypothetical protein
MANNIPFQPMGSTYKVVLPTANTAVTVSVTATSPSNQYLIGNHDATNKPVYVRIGDTNVAATLPADGVPGNTVMVPANTKFVMTGPQSSTTKTVYVSVIAEHNNAECYVTPGEGL